MIKYTENVENFLVKLNFLQNQQIGENEELISGFKSAIKDTFEFMIKSEILKYESGGDVYIESEYDFFYELLKWLLKISRITFSYSSAWKEVEYIGYGMGISFILMTVDILAELDEKYKYTAVLNIPITDEFRFTSKHTITELRRGQNLIVYEIEKDY